MFALPEPGQSVLWQTGLVTYVVPLALAPLAVRLSCMRSVPPALSALLASVIVFVAGGFSETFAAMQVAACVVLVAFAWQGSGVPRVRSAGLLLASATASMLVVAFAPGNAVRASLLPPGPTIVDLGLGIAVFTAKLVAVYLRDAWEYAAIALTAGVALTPHVAVRGRGRHLIAIPAVALVLVAACAAPSAYALGGPPPGRALVIPYSLLNCSLLVAGIAAGQSWRNRRAHALAVTRVSIASVLLVPLVAVAGVRDSAVVLRAWSDWRAFAHSWDGRDTALTGLPETAHATVRGFPNPLSLERVGPQRDHWVNRAVAGYYGVRSLVAVEETAGPDAAVGEGSDGG